MARPERNVLEPLRREVDQLFDEFARVLNTLAVPGNGSFMPNTEITETDQEFVITAELPGLERKDVEISLEDNVMTIRGERKTGTTLDDKNKNVHVKEREDSQMDYRAYLIDEHDHIIDAHTFVAANDEVALIHAHQYANDRDVELWHRSRRVGLIPRELKSIDPEIL